MKKLADISAFERLQQPPATPTSVFNTNYEECTEDIYQAFYKGYNTFRDACDAFGDSVEELNALYTELTDYGVFAERPRMEAPMREVINKYEDMFYQYDHKVSNVIQEWKERCYYGLFWKGMRLNGYSGSIDDELPDYVAHSLRHDLFDATDGYLSRFKAAVLDIEKAKDGLSKCIKRYSKLRDEVLGE